MELYQSFFSGCNNFHFVNEQIGYIGSNGVKKTIDGGATWNYVINPYFYVSDIYAFDENNVIAIGDTSLFLANYGKIYRTTDGGVTWSKDTYPYDPQLHHLNFPSIDTGYMRGIHRTGLDPDRIYKSIDNGISWRTDSILYPTPLILGGLPRYAIGNLHCPSNNTCYAVGNILLDSTNNWTNFRGWIITNNIIKVGIKKNKKISDEGSISVFPNPATDQVLIRYESENEKSLVLDIYNTIGKLVYHETVMANKGITEKQIELAGFSAGVYILKLQTSERSAFNKIIIAH